MHISKWITLGLISVRGTCSKLRTKFFAHYYCRVGGEESSPVWSKKYLSFQSNSIRDCTCFKSTFSVKRVLSSVLSVYCHHTFKVFYYKILAYFTCLAQAFGLQRSKRRSILNAITKKVTLIGIKYLFLTLPRDRL